MSPLILFSILGRLYFVDLPTARGLSHGEYSLGLRLQDDNGVVAQVGVGFFDQFNIGVSYGGLKVLGRGSPELYPRPEFQGRVLIWPDYGYYPGVTLGFDSQGLGRYRAGRYELISKGFYLAVGKELLSGVGETEVGIGLNYSLEGNGKINCFLGIAHSFSPNLTLLLEYDLARDDSLTRARGYLNLGVGWRFMETIGVELEFRDLLKNRAGVARTARLSYQDRF